MGEAGQLEQAFLNLILNAAEAMPEGGTLTITSRAVALPRQSERPTHVAMDFTDTGHGMSPEQRRRAFSSVLSSTKAKGTGLGLAIVARVVETHRGQVKIKSRTGQGTTIRVLLPIERPVEPAEAISWGKKSNG
jgi:two-component system nitrogen regulation sensor histidine kinase GlnL